MHGAVHGLQVVILTLLADIALCITLLIHLHGRVHAVGIPVKMPGGLEQRSLRQVRGVGELVAFSDVAAPGIVLHLHPHHCAVGVEHRQA